MPVTNVSTNTTTQRYYDSLVLGFRQSSAPMFNIFAVDASAKAAGRDQVVTTNVFVVSGSAATTYNAANGFTLSAGNRKGIPVTLNNYKFSSAALTQAEILESSIVSLQQSAQANATELVNAVFYDNLNYISSSAVFPSFTNQASASSYSYSKLVDIRTTAVSTYKWNGPAYLVVNSNVFGQLLKDSTLAQAYVRGMNDVVTGNNLFRTIVNPGAGWNAIYEAPDIAFTNGTVGYAVTPNALSVAMRYWEPPTYPYNVAMAVTDPSDPNGLTLGYREWADPNFDETRAVTTALWGKAVVNPQGALLLTATVNA